MSWVPGAAGRRSRAGRRPAVGENFFIEGGAARRDANFAAR
jgi:hypothetical protein